MQNTAQAGLEYLMTYGWTLIILVTVASALFFVLAPPTETFTCRSSDPTKIVLESYNVPYSGQYMTQWCNPATVPDKCAYWGYTSEGDLPGEFVLQNATGGPINITYAYGLYSNTYFPKKGGGTCRAIWMFFPLMIGGRSYGTLPSNPLAIPAGGKIHVDSFRINQTSMTYPSCPLSSIEFPPKWSFELKYTDQFGYTQDVNIVCNGYPAKT
ncbi:MAG: hypothetical protein JW772_00545 [Candidatus Diapherotrites archaeon]|nr:hypothetical protein [Candidatus Diapherotrites archaeon]